jgi:D-arabinose 5-phosphate isomerase GutQ
MTEKSMLVFDISVFDNSGVFSGAFQAELISFKGTDAHFVARLENTVPFSPGTILLACSTSGSIIEFLGVASIQKEWVGRKLFFFIEMVNQLY